MSYKKFLIQLVAEANCLLELPEVDVDAPTTLDNSDLQRVLHKHKVLTRNWDDLVKTFGTTYKQEATSRRVGNGAI